MKGGEEYMATKKAPAKKAKKTTKKKEGDRWIFMINE
jgi:hypothetical protein